MRIVSLSPATTQLLVALGLEGQIAGACRPGRPAAAVDLGSPLAPDLDEVRTLRPDVVVMATYGSVQNALKPSGLRVAAFDFDSVGAVLTACIALGRLTGAEAAAVRLVRRLERQLLNLRGLTVSLPRRRVLVAAAEQPSLFVGGENFLDSLVGLAGGLNMTGRHSCQYVPLDPHEAARRFDPEVIIVLAAGADRRETRRLERLWRRLPCLAGRTGRVHVLADGRIFLPGTGIVRTLRAFIRCIHPGSMPG